MNNDWREYICDPSYLAHHGIKGQKWGVRKYQNMDGTLTSEGKQRYGSKADRVEKFSRKAASWEGRAINAKTGIGRQFSTGMATWRRQKADKVGAKATGDYKMLALNKNAARNARATAETHANIAQGLKNRADASKAGSAKQKLLMEKAIQNLATAENAEGMGTKYSAISKSKGLIMKTSTFITKTLNETTRTKAGRESNIKDKIAESIGDEIISRAVKSKTSQLKQKTNNKAAQVGLDVASNIAGRGVVSGGRDIYYRSKNSQQSRWNNMAKNK